MLQALAAIYGHHCPARPGLLRGGSADRRPRWPSRRAAVVALGLPYLVAEQDGKVLGYAYAGPFRPARPIATRSKTASMSPPTPSARASASAVLTEVLKACEALGVRQVMAVIGDSGNAGSIGLHAALGLRARGHLQERRLQAWPVGRHRLDAEVDQWRRRDRCLTPPAFGSAATSYELHAPAAAAHCRSR